MLTRKYFAFICLVTGLLVFSGMLRAQSGRLNILVFTADDLDRNTLGCYGSGVPAISPNIDQLAEEGIRFEHAFVNYSICAPSRAILATGLYGHNSGVMGFMKMEEESPLPLIMEIFRANDYRVGVLGKVGHSTPKENFSWDYTIDADELGIGRSPTLYYQKTRTFLEACRESRKPFYLMVNSHDPHRPFFNPDEPLRKGMERPSRIYTAEEVPVPGFLPDLPGVREEISYYYNSAKRLDDTFGMVMKALEKSGYRQNTLVLFMSDNGIAVPFAKCDNYYASARTPWIARWPGVIQPGQVNETHFISEVDFMPTILEAAGLDIPKNMDGISRWPLYIGKEQKNDGVVFTQIDNKARGRPMPMRGIAVPMRGVQTEDFLYIFNPWSDGERIYANNNEGLTMKAMEKAAEIDPDIAARVEFFRYRVPEEFYDLKNDPDCLVNLIDDSEYTDLVTEYRRMLRQWMRKTDDPLLFIFENRKDPGKTLPRLYEIYPALRSVDEGKTTARSRTCNSGNP